MDQIKREKNFQRAVSQLLAIEREYGTGGEIDPEQSGIRLVVDNDPPMIADQRGSGNAPAYTVIELNDAFREGCLSPSPVVPGAIDMSDKIEALGEEAVNRILAKVAAYDDFTPETDPEGLHSFGAVDDEAGEVLWHIDVYESAESDAEAQHPEDPTRSFRELMLMLGTELH
ncbi:MAG: DUF3768 domain-containing protein [Pseudomonadota bacterium]